MTFPIWLNRQLVVQTRTGKLYPPGGGCARSWKQPEGGDVTIAAHGDAFDLYIGKSDVYNVTLTPEIAKSLALWILWWWVARTWCGVKTRLWNWSLGKILERS